MRLTIKLFPVALALIIFLASCSGKKQNPANLISNNAIAVAGFNIKSLEQKIFQDSATFKNIIAGIKNGETDTELKAIFDEYTKMKSSGIDLNEKLYLAQVPSKTKPAQFFAALASLNDQKKFIEYINTNFKDKFTQSKNGDYTIFKENKSTAGVLVTNGSNVLFLKQNEGETAGIVIEDEALNIFKTPSAESIANNVNFKELEKTEADGFVFSNLNKSVKQLKAIDGLGNLKDLVSNLDAGGILKFEQGKLSINTTIWPNEKLSAVLGKYAGPVVDASKIEKFPVKTLNGFMQVNFNPDLLMGLLTEANILDLAAAGANAAFDKKPEVSGNPLLKGVNPFDLNKMFGGKVNLIIGDLVEDKPDNTEGFGAIAGSMKALVELPIANKESYKKVIDTLLGKGVLVKLEDGNIQPFFNADPSSSLGISITDNKIVIASNKTLLGNYETGTTSPLTVDLKNKMSNASTAIFLDGKSFGKRFFPENNAQDTIAKNNILPILNNVFFALNNYSAGTIKGNFDINLTDEKTNALPVMLKAIANFYKAKKTIPQEPILAK